MSSSATVASCPPVPNPLLGPSASLHPPRRHVEILPAPASGPATITMTVPTVTQVALREATSSPISQMSVVPRANPQVIATPQAAPQMIAAPRATTPLQIIPQCMPEGTPRSANVPQVSVTVPQTNPSSPSSPPSPPALAPTILPAVTAPHHTNLLPAPAVVTPTSTSTFETVSVPRSVPGPPLAPASPAASPTSLPSLSFGQGRAPAVPALLPSLQDTPQQQQNNKQSQQDLGPHSMGAMLCAALASTTAASPTSAPAHHPAPALATSALPARAPLSVVAPVAAPGPAIVPSPILPNVISTSADMSSGASSTTGHIMPSTGRGPIMPSVGTGPATPASSVAPLHSVALNQGPSNPASCPVPASLAAVAPPSASDPPGAPGITTAGTTSTIRLNKFVRRLHDMLQSEADSGIVEWRRGLLVLHSTDAFAKRVLPKYFNTRNFKTFRRQLNYYGFVHVRSFSATGSTTTALWVNQDLAKRGTKSVSSVLMLKRVEPSETAKTAEGRRARKEEAAGTVEGIGIDTRTLQMEQIRTLALRGAPDVVAGAVGGLGAAPIVPNTMAPPSPPSTQGAAVPMTVYCHPPTPSPLSTLHPQSQPQPQPQPQKNSVPEIALPNPWATTAPPALNVAPKLGMHQVSSVPQDMSMDDTAANLLLMLSRSGGTVSAKATA